MHWYFGEMCRDCRLRKSSSAYPDFVQWPVMCCRTCFHYKQSCRQVSAGSSHLCKWARQSGRTHVSTAGCHCRQWKCPPCLAPVLGWSPSGFGSSPPAGGSCADGYCDGHFLTVHSYRNTHQRQETNIKSYLVPLAICSGFVKLLLEEVDGVTWVKVRKLSYQFLRTSVVIKAAITIMRDTVIVIIWWTAKPAKRQMSTWAENYQNVSVVHSRQPHTSLLPCLYKVMRAAHLKHTRMTAQNNFALQ